MTIFKKTIKRLLFITILGLMFTPLFQQKFEYIPIVPLKGAITPPKSKPFTWHNWFSGEFQSQNEDYIKNSFGFRNELMLFNNQMAFDLFGKAKANGVIVGKENYLYENNYIDAYFGRDFIGVDSIVHRMQRLKYIQDTLSKLNKTLLLVLAPGKGSYFPEYFPDHLIGEKGPTNYTHHAQLANNLGINHIDFHKYFLENKHTSPYPLFPKYGIHWSTYGSLLAADSMIKYVEKIRNIDMPDLYWDEIAMDKAIDHDYDIGYGLNLMYYLESYPMAYPNLQIEPAAGKTKPSALVIADSYYWILYNTSFAKVLADNQFWFYNKQVYPEWYKNGKEIIDVNLPEEIQKHEVIIIMATDATLPNMGWGFIESTFKELQQK